MDPDKLNQSLFVKTAMEKTATYEMSQDVQDWDQDVIKYLNEEHADITEQNIDINFKKTDNKKGYGYGFVSFGQHDDIKIPIIIKEYQMYPMDVVLYKGKAYPLTEDTIEELAQKTDLGKISDKKTSSDTMVGPNISSRIYPGQMTPRGSRGISGYKTASAKDEYESILDGIGVTEKQAATFVDKIKNDDELVASWASSECPDVLKKIAAVKDSPDRVKPSEAHPLVAAFIKKDDVASDVLEISQSGTYLLEGLSGAEYKGQVFPGVYDFSLQPVGVTLFSGSIKKNRDNGESYWGDSCGAVQAKIAGVPFADTDCDAGGRMPSKGDSGFFVISKGSVSMAFIPVKILSKAIIRENRTINMNKSGQHVEVKKDFETRKMVVQDGMGTRYNIVMSPLVTDVKIVNGIVMMPSAAKWNNLGELVKLKSEVGQMKKVASGRSVTMRHLGGESFSIESPWAEDWTKEGALQNRIKGYLGTYYTVDSIDPLFAEAVKCGRVHFNDRAPADKAESFKWPEAHKIARDLTKIAAALPNPELVDTVLSLQFINKDNVKKFLGYIPNFEKVSSQLADLLIASRLGLAVDEYPIKTAMENLSEVINDLRMLKGK